jgi:hypothetical protein
MMTGMSEPNMQRPSVGRVVHYVSYGTPGGEFESTCRAATITEVGEQPGTVGLCVQNPTGLFFHPLADGGSRHNEESKAGGTWHWPERV